MELISQEPVRIVHGRKAVCDGGTYTLHSTARVWYDGRKSVLGMGPLGHPKVFINLVRELHDYFYANLANMYHRISLVQKLAGEYLSSTVYQTINPLNHSLCPL